MNRIARGCRVFEVIGSSGGGRHPLHVAACVIAPSAEVALQMFAGHFPTAEIHNVNVKGPDVVLLAIDEEMP